MSEKMTRIRLGKKGPRFMDWGEHSFERMVAQIKAQAAREFEEAKAILDAKDDDFEVAVVRGPIVQHFVRKVEPSSKAEG